MTDTAIGPAACPACPTAPEIAVPEREYLFHLPSIHCAGCISAVERGLRQVGEVRAARVNLSGKRVTVRAVDRPGMAEALQEALEALGFPAEVLDTAALSREGADTTGRLLLLRLGIAGFAAMNVMLLSVAVWSGAEGATRTLLHWISALIALPTIVFAAQPFFANAWAGLKARRLVMDTPISLAILLAAAVSLSETILGGDHAYFDAALSLTFFLLLGRFLDHRSRLAARSAATELAALGVPRVERIDADGQTRVVGIAEVAPGDRLRVAPGMRIPADGRILVGQTELDRSLLTGESAPVPVAEGDGVRAGEITLTGALEVEVEAVGDAALLHQITELVRAAEAARNRFVSLADRAARVYAPLVHVLAFVAFAAWYGATGDLRLSINIATAVLIITCPCALGLAVPSVMISASGRLFRQGVLLKDGTALERLAAVDAVALDKTGTLTDGAPRLLEADGVSDADLARAAALGQGSRHPLAQALVAEAAARGLDLPAVSDLREIPGSGIAGRIGDVSARLGRASWIGLDDPGAGETTATWLSVAGAAPRRFGFSDRLRPGAAEMIRDLKARGMALHLLSGDTAGPVARIARDLGIEAPEAGLTPDQKQQRIAALKAEGHTVLMLGDGLNDTAALTTADVSMSPASGMDITRNAADIILLGNDLSVVPDAARIARIARRRMLQNFGLAAGYNLLAVPVALAGFATPLMAALAMSASSICVSLNALRFGGGRR